MKAAFKLQSSRVFEKPKSCLKASLVPTKHKPIPFLKLYSPIPICICSLSFNLTLLKSQNFWAASPYALDISEQNRSKSYCDQNPTLIFQMFLIDFIPGRQTSKFR